MCAPPGIPSPPPPPPEEAVRVTPFDVFLLVAVLLWGKPGGEGDSGSRGSLPIGICGSLKVRA